MIYVAKNDHDRFELLTMGVPVYRKSKNIRPKSRALKMSLSNGIKTGMRVLITEDTKHLFPAGYNWVNSCPIVKGTGRKNVGLAQIGYPYMFLISVQEFWRMRHDYVAKFGPRN